MGARTAKARFHYHGDANSEGPRWFSVGDDVPAEIVEKYGDNPYLFDDEPEQDEPVKRPAGRPRKNTE